jgi:phosphonate transport system substrate-binding protein
MCLAIICLASPAMAASSERPLILGVHPYLSYSQLQVRFAPLARYIADELGRRVSVRVGRNYEEHIVETGKDRLDISYLGPVSYVKVSDVYGRKPLLAQLERNGKTRLSGHIVVTADADIHTLSDLKGKAFAFGDPASTMSSIVPRAHLAASGITIEDLAYTTHLQGHTNVAFAVLTGQADAGAVKEEVLQEFEGRGLRSLEQLPQVSEHLFVTRADLPTILVSRLREILLNAHKDERGRRALLAINSQTTSLAPVSDDDYDNLRTMLKLTGARGNTDEE